MITTSRKPIFPPAILILKKDLSINDELDKLRLQATAHYSAAEGISSLWRVWAVSMVWATLTDYENGIIRIQPGQSHIKTGFLHALVNSLYNRSEGDFTRGTFRVKGDTIDINLPYVDFGYRITFWRWNWNIETLELKPANASAAWSMRQSSCKFIRGT